MFDATCKNDFLHVIFIANALSSTQTSPFEGAPEEFDQTIFTVQKDRTIGLVEGLTLNLVKEQQRYRSMVSTILKKSPLFSLHNTCLP